MTLLFDVLIQILFDIRVQKYSLEIRDNTKQSLLKTFKTRLSVQYTNTPANVNVFLKLTFIYNQFVF